MADDSKILQELNQMYTDAESADKDVWAEMRSNILLVAGEHYSKKNYKQFQHIRENSNLSEEQKIRLTKNHINRISKIYINNIVGMCPGVHMKPNNEKETQDIKAAQLHQTVWESIKQRHGLRAKFAQYASDFCVLGETLVKVSWDWTKGDLKSTTPILNEGGQQEGESHEWTGDLSIERIFAFNMFRPKECQCMEDAPWIGIRRMESHASLKEHYKDDEEKLKMIEPDGKSTFMVFDHNTTAYAEKKEHVLIKEVYYKPSPEYPKGWFYYYTENGILEQGELPFGRWPFAFAGFDEIPTHPRYRSMIKQLRPYQVELNRVASKIAEHQITLGDDKLIVGHGSKMSVAGSQPGIRAYSVSGQSPTVIPGRSGEQYFQYAVSTVSEMYQAGMVQEHLEEKQVAQVDPYALLLTSGKWKKNFSLPIQRFEDFLKDLSKLCLETMRDYVSEEDLVRMVGRHERVNVAEFKNRENLLYQINIEPQTDDPETRLGRKLSIDRFIQYAGQNLSKEDVGKFIRQDPFLNKEEIFADLTRDYDYATNTILAMDRGQMPFVSKYENSDYMLKKLTARMMQADFQYLPPQIQNLYGQQVAMHEQALQQKAQEQAYLASQMFPSGGMLVTCDMYVPDEMDPTKQKRVRVPYDALNELLKRLNAQGMTQQALAQQQQGVVSDIVRNMQTRQPPQAQGTMPPQQGQQVPQQPLPPGVARPQPGAPPQVAQLRSMINK